MLYPFNDFYLYYFRTFDSSYELALKVVYYSLLAIVHRNRSLSNVRYMYIITHFISDQYCSSEELQIN